ncbi:hypothetical protein [Halobellus clavatus]|jgi:hypothetical protein|uniref:Uncharacterized protein n=1 Tax=Halobellus clavatus TaxID=660517 RepID=A0A1H3FN35_9EURY|nr:hypothetical protein [Halobellus clavatus]SDX92452.1 hypothetical protein SAMN04487946_10474 [Halobellus clavatus]
MTNEEGLALGVIAISVAWIVGAQIAISMGDLIPEPLLRRLAVDISGLWRPYLATGAVLGVIDLLAIAVVLILSDRSS